MKVLIFGLPCYYRNKQPHGCMSKICLGIVCVGRSLQELHKNEKVHSYAMLQLPKYLRAYHLMLYCNATYMMPFCFVGLYLGMSHIYVVSVSFQFAEQQKSSEILSHKKGGNCVASDFNGAKRRIFTDLFDSQLPKLRERLCSK